MANQEKRNNLDVGETIVSFKDLIKHKIEDKKKTKEGDINDILKTVTKTCKSVNKRLVPEE